MRIAFDARPISQKPSGIGVYTIKIAERLLERGHEIVLVSDSPDIYWKPEGEAAKRVTVFSEGRSGSVSSDLMGKFLWEEEILPGLIEKSKADVYHAVSNKGVPKIGVPSVVTVHDLIPFVFPESPEYYYFKYAAYGLAVNRADRIICISKHTEKDLLRFFPETKGKIKVVYNGVDAVKKGAPNPFREKAPYIVYNGGFGARKNVDGLVRSFAEIIKADGYEKLTLLILGEKVGTYQETYDLVKKIGMEKRVMFAGYIKPDEMGPILADAACMIYPSLYEGFGLPPLEAMSAGCPVISSKNSSLEEVVGEAGILVDPTDENQIVDSFKRVMEDKALRGKLIADGYKWVNNFSWDRSAGEVEKIYKKVV